MSTDKLNVGDFGDDVARLHEKLKARGFEVSPEEVKRRFFGPATTDAVRECQREHGLSTTGVVDDRTDAALTGAIATRKTPPIEDTHVPHPIPAASVTPAPPEGPTLPNLGTSDNATGGAAPGQSRISGIIALEHGLPAAKLKVRLYQRGFGGNATKLSETTTVAGGRYAFAYDSAGKAMNLEVRAVDAQGKEIPLSDIKLAAAPQEVMNLVAPAALAPLLPEYARLAADIEKEIGSVAKLAEAQEGGERRDLSLLHQATGWDARLLAMASTAGKLSAETKLPQEVLYSLLRVGFPSDPQMLASVSTETVGQALVKAKDSGIVNLTDQQIADAQKKLATYASTVRLKEVLPGASSTVGDVLGKSGLTDQEKTLFADVYFSHTGTGQELWTKAKAKGLSDPKIASLRLQGKLSYLTFNNAPLVEELQKGLTKPDDLSPLVEKELYKRDTWVGLIKTLDGTNEQAIAGLIPPAYTGDNLTDRLNAYADDLASKVRIAFPAKVMGKMVEKGELKVGNQSSAIGSQVRSFLVNAEKDGFVLGQTPITTFVKEHEATVFSGISPGAKAEVLETVTTLQRVHQMTPSDEAMVTTLQLGFTSAHDILAFSYEEYMDRFADRYRTRKEAELVYRKAQQISAVTYNFFTIAKQLDSAPPVAAISTAPAVRKQTKELLIKQYPTMESLFGSMDYCECEHCQSVLSPAAYFVDLLQFLEPEPAVWNHFLEDWKAKHNGEDFTTKYKKPYDALIARRPDLPHLSLTCENTHTALPYIDIVNEILEYYVAKSKLDKNAARDTRTATTAELLAEPENIEPTAYETLEKAGYPLTLPFNLWLETVRGFCEYFETPLWEVMETFRSTDDLFKATGSTLPYDRAAIFIESLGLSPAEYALFTDANPLANWHLLYGFDDPAQTAAVNQQNATAALTSAKTLSWRLSVTYKELVALVQTWFVNPKLDSLVLLHKLGIDLEDVFRYKGVTGYPAFTPEELAAFEQRLADAGVAFSIPAADIKALLETAWVNGDFNQALLLYDPEAGCNFEQTALRYANAPSTAVDGLVFLKLNYFVRLWKKLGWSIEETDRALQTFIPKKSRPLSATTLGSALKTALVSIAHLTALDARLPLGKDSRYKLLTFWSDLPTTGEKPLYAQLFLAHNVLKNDPVFDDPLGRYLSKAGLLVKDHLPALQGALGLMADDVELIVLDVGAAFDTAPLSLANVSLLYRYGVLAKTLKVSIRELIALKGLSGRNPFKALFADPVTKLEEDYPYSETWKFIEMAGLIKSSNFTPEDLEFLIRHQSLDPVGKYRSHPVLSLALIREIAAGVDRIESEHTAPPDPMTLTDEMLQQKLALIFPAEVVEKFMGMWTGNILYQAKPVNVPEASAIDPAGFVGQPALQVHYDKTRQRQQLAFRGVLVESKKQELKTLNASPVLAAMLDDVQEQAKHFFAEHFVATDPQFQGFFAPADIETLFAPSDGLTDSQKQDQLKQKREKLAGALIPFLRRRLIRLLIAGRMTSELNADPALVGVLLSDKRLLEDPSQTGSALIGAFDAIRVRGVSVTFFDGAGNSLAIDVVETVDTSLTRAGLPIMPANTKRVRYEGYFEAPATGPYRFVAILGSGTVEAELRMDHLADPVFKGTPAAGQQELGAFLDLNAGNLYGFTFEVRNLGTTGVSLQVLSEGLSKGPLSRFTLYPRTAVERVQRAHVLLAKIVQLIQGLNLTEREVRYLLTHRADFDQIDLAKLPTRKEDVTPTGSLALFNQFLRLLEYVRIRQEMVGGSDDLVTVFERSRGTRSAANAGQASADHLKELSRLLAEMTRRESAVVESTVRQLGFAGTATPSGSVFKVEAVEFTHERGLKRLWDVLRLAGKFGIGVSTLARSAEVVDPTKTSQDRFVTARDLRNAVKAYYETEAWQRVAQPIFDKLRQRQRDALVAYVMHREGFARLEQLFEHFLIDPGMEPVVQTSRLRLAISSVQLFTQRCLLSLEKAVHPSTINSKHWQWMKRYRVWEANRKIFLFPENWLEPEFRDDKTHLFQELESALLQGDVSSDLVEDAFFAYLKKLDELARLEVVAMYLEERPLDPASNTVHVMGRTFNAPHKYFYRRYAYEMWTPWEPVEVDIEGDHVVIVVWRERLNLFWVTFVEKASDPPAGQPVVNDSDSVGKIANILAQLKPPKEVQVQLNWSELFQGQWTTRQSSGFGSPIRTAVPYNFNNRDVFIHASKEYEEGEERGVKISLSGANFGAGNTAFWVINKNSVPEIVGRDWSLMTQPYPVTGVLATRYRGDQALKVSYEERILTDASFLSSGPAVSSWAAGRLDVFVRGLDNALWHKWFQNGWSGWESLGGELTSDPAAVSWGSGRIDVFVRGTDSALFHKWFENGWSGWESLGGGLSSGPAVCSWSNGRLDVFVRGLENALWHKWFQNGWSGWESLGGELTSDPAAVSWGPGRIDVFVRGTDAALWHKWFVAGTGWSGWESLGGVLSSGPAVSSWAADRLDVFVRGADNALWHKWFQNGWSGWESLGGVLTSDPATASWSNGRIDVFARGEDSSLIHKWFENGWSGWESLGGLLSAAKPLSPAPKTILAPVGSFNLLTNNAIVPGQDQAQRELMSLVSPFFFEDRRHTFFVVPTMVEKKINEWDEWVVSVPRIDWKEQVPGWGKVYVEPQIPRKELIPPLPVDPFARYKFRVTSDWATNSQSVYEFENRLVGQSGVVHLADTMAGPDLTAVLGSSVDSGKSQVAKDISMMTVMVDKASKADSLSGSRVTVIGRNGLAPGVVRDIGELSKTRLDERSGIAGARF